MRYDVQITFDDYKALQKLQHARMTKLLTLCCSTVMLVVTVWHYWASAGKDVVVIFIPLLVAFGVLCSLLGVYLPAQWKRDYKNNKSLQEPFSYEFTEDAFCVLS